MFSFFQILDTVLTSPPSHILDYIPLNEGNIILVNKFDWLYSQLGVVVTTHLLI